MAARLTRRAFLATAAAGAATGPFVFTPAKAQSFNWKRFQGKEHFLMLTKHPFIDVLEKNIPEFESLSGMKVKWETLPEIQARQKMTVEMTANSGGIDAFFTSLHVEKKRFWKAGWYHPLNKFLADPSLTSPDFDWNDFTPGARAGVTQPDGSISALAAFVDANVFFYRKGLFGPKGLTPARTLAELEPPGKKVHAPPGTYGIVLRGLKNANATQYPSILLPIGGTSLMCGKAKPKMPADWYQAYQDSLKIGRQGLPEIVGVTEYRDIIGVAIQKGIEGAPAAQVLAQAQKDFQDLLNRTES